MQLERLDKLLPVIVGAVATTIAIAAMGSWPVGSYQDDAMYLVLAKALATGEGYRYLNIPGHPAATHFPPGYPAFLAALWRLAPQFPGNVALFTMANAILYGLAAAGIFYLARARFELGRGPALVVTALGFATASTLGLAGLVMSEPLYMALFVPVLLLCDRASVRDDWRSVGIAALACVALTMVRSIGVVALAAFIMTLVLRRRYQAAAGALFVGAIAMLPWKLWMMVHAGELPRLIAGEYGSYDGWLAEGFRRGGVTFAGRVVAMNLHDVATVLVAPNNVDGASAVVMHPGRIALAVVMSGLVIFGLTHVARRSLMLSLYAAGYLLLILLWPFEPSRFVRALWPLLVLVMWLGAIAVIVQMPRRLRPTLITGIGLILLVHAAPLLQAWAAREWEKFPKSWALPIVSQVQWVVGNTEPNDVIISDRATAVYLYTGRYAVPPADFQPMDRMRPASPERLERSIRAIAEDYDASYMLLYNAHLIRAARALTAAVEPRWRFLDGQMKFGTVLAKIEP